MEVVEPTCIQELHPYTKADKIKVRVCRIWKSTIPGSVQKYTSLHSVLLDETVRNYCFVILIRDYNCLISIYLSLAFLDNVMAMYLDCTLKFLNNFSCFFFFFNRWIAHYHWVLLLFHIFFYNCSTNLGLRTMKYQQKQSN